MPTARPSARCSTASRRWRACASSRRRAASTARRSATSTAGATSSSACPTCGKARCCWPRTCCARRWRAPRATSAGAARSPACWRRCWPPRVWERNQPDEAAALLANRLDVLERSGLPEAVLLGLSHDGAHRRRRGRRAPRARAAGRARRGRRGAPPAAPAHRQPGRPGAPARAPLPRRRPAATCARRSMRCWPTRDAPQGPLWRRSVVAAARAGAGLRGDRRAGLAPRRRAAGARRRAGAGATSRAGCTSSCWACAPGCSTAAARSRCRLLREAVDLAAAYGLLRVFDDAHPGARRLGARGACRRASAAPAGAGPLAAPPRPAPAAAGAAPRRRATPSMALTPKEREVLRAAGAQPVEQGDRPGDAGRRRDDQVAHEEPVRQARRRHAQAGGAARPHPGAARNRSR